MTKEFFEQLTPDMALKIILALCLLVVVVSIGLVFILRAGRIRKLFGLETNSDSEKQGNDLLDKKQSPHADCQFAPDGPMLLAKQRELLTKQGELRMNALVEQKSIAKSESVKLRGFAQSEFLKILKEKQGGDKNGLVMHDDYREYVRCLKDAIDDVLILLEAEFMKNHYAQRTRPEFTVYASSMADTLIQTMTDMLNDTYIGSVVSREETYDRMVLSAKHVRSEIESVFWQAREIAVTTAERIATMEKEFTELARKIYPNY